MVPHVFGLVGTVIWLSFSLNPARTFTGSFIVAWWSTAQQELDCCRVWSLCRRIAVFYSHAVLNELFHVETARLVDTAFLFINEIVIKILHTILFSGIFFLASTFSLFFHVSAIFLFKVNHIIKLFNKRYFMEIMEL